MYAVIAVLIAALANSFWMALSKKSFKDQDSLKMAVLVRALTVVFLFPLFITHIPTPTDGIFWLYAIIAGILDVTCVYTLFLGYKRDYFTTYGLFNASPILIYIFSYFFLGGESFETLTTVGVLLTVAGGLIFAFQGHIKNASWGIASMLLITASVMSSKMAFQYIDDSYGYPFIAFVPGTLFLFFLYGLKRKNFSVKSVTSSFTKIHLLAAFISTISTVCWFYAIKNGDLVIVYTVFRVSMVFAFIFSWFMLKERLNAKTKALAGLLTVVGTVLLFL